MKTYFLIQNSITKRNISGSGGGGHNYRLDGHSQTDIWYLHQTSSLPAKQRNGQPFQQSDEFWSISRWTNVHGSHI